MHESVNEDGQLCVDVPRGSMRESANEDGGICVDVPRGFLCH